PDRVQRSHHPDPGHRHRPGPGRGSCGGRAMSDSLLGTAPDGRPTIDFGHHSPAYRGNWENIAAQFHATGRPIAWSEHHGGFWVTASWDVVQRVGSEWETFTSVNDLAGGENGGRGQSIPQMPYRLFLGESAPPLHTERRRLE